MKFSSSSLTGAFAVSLSSALTRAQSASPDSSEATVFAGCQQNNASFKNTQANFTLSHDHSALDVNFQGESSVSGNATIHIWLYSQSQVLSNSVYDPCLDLALAPFCPLSEGPFNVTMNHGAQFDGITLPDVGALELAVTTDGEAALTCVEESIQGGGKGGPEEGSSLPNSNSSEGDGGNNDAVNGASASNNNETPDDSSSGSSTLEGWGFLL